MRVFPTIIFTKLEHLANDIKCKIIESEEEEEVKFSNSEKDQKILSRATEVITDYMNKVLEQLPRSKFFIFNPSSKDSKKYQFAYKFEYIYGPKNQVSG